MLNLGLVYFLEYMCLTSFAERIVAKINLDHPERKDDYLFKHGYVVFTFCYQIGVFLSRSSLSIVKIKRVVIVTLDWVSSCYHTASSLQRGNNTCL
jgi:battenin